MDDQLEVALRRREPGKPTVTEVGLDPRERKHRKGAVREQQRPRGEEVGRGPPPIRAQPPLVLGRLGAGVGHDDLQLVVELGELHGRETNGWPAPTTGTKATRATGHGATPEGKVPVSTRS